MIPEKLIRYLELIFGKTPDLEIMDENERAGLQYHLCSRYDFIKWVWSGCITILAIDKTGETATPSEYGTHAEILSRHFHNHVALVFTHIDSYKRNRLVHHGTSFIVTGGQLFLPPLIDLRERLPRIKRSKMSEKLSASAQLVILTHIIKKNMDGISLRDLAGKLGYSAMTMSNISEEISGHGLCSVVKQGRRHCLCFNHNGRNLWDVALPFLTSPVSSCEWIGSMLNSIDLFRAGYSALSNLTDISDDPIPCFACRDSTFRKKKIDGELVSTGGSDDAICMVQTWKYEPGILAENNQVDRLSLYLSLNENSNDERTQKAVQSLLEDCKW